VRGAAAGADPAAKMAPPANGPALQVGMRAADEPWLEAEQAVLMTDHGELGALAAEAWQLPEAIVEAIRFHHTPSEASTPLATMVSLADGLAHATVSEDPFDMPDGVTMAAIEALGIAPADYGGLVVATLERYELLADRFAA
jgi:HDOD domain